jgi:hypothetical protein
MSITLELSLDEAAAVAVALNALMWDETVGPISEGWRRDAVVVQDRLAILRDEAKRPRV